MTREVTRRRRSASAERSAEAEPPGSAGRAPQADRARQADRAWRAESPVRVGPAADAASRPRPFYARALRLRHLHPSGVLCFVFLEGAVALAVVLALAELVSWWGVLVLPAAVAVMVKINDAVAGMSSRADHGSAAPAEAPPSRRVRQPAGRRRAA